jgi:alkaline phosphatase
MSWKASPQGLYFNSSVATRSNFPRPFKADSAPTRNPLFLFRTRLWYRFIMIRSLAATLVLISALTTTALAGPRSAIFLHPDGMGANTWSVVRLAEVGPDGRLAWDRLPETAVYVGPMLDNVTATSNGGATTHAYGVRAESDSYGLVNAAVPGQSIARQAQAAGKAIGFVNSSTVTEPGTGAFLASTSDRDNHADIAAQMLDARPQVIMGGGEQWFLPRGVMGIHGPGGRADGRDLIAEARAAGYFVVRTREELAALPADATHVLGLFAHEDTFNEGTEAHLARRRVSPFQPQAPRFDEMIAAAIQVLERDADGYLLVGNEEASDNFGGDNNAAAVIDAGAGADRAIAVALRAHAANPNLTIVVASDSDCGGAQASGDDQAPGRRVPSRNQNGAPQDGDRGRPFLSAPDRNGVRQPFVVTWANEGDVSGGVVARGIGPGAAAILHGTIDSTYIHRALAAGLFE